MSYEDLGITRSEIKNRLRFFYEDEPYILVKITRRPDVTLLRIHPEGCPDYVEIIKLSDLMGEED